ncbi:MAG: hypothetical protein ACJAUP_001103 [Cellvibrionaceae bacterium]|jgi:hypothetical protein
MAISTCPWGIQEQKMAQHPCTRGIRPTWTVEVRSCRSNYRLVQTPRSYASMHPRDTVHPVHKKTAMCKLRPFENEFLKSS